MEAIYKRKPVIVSNCRGNVDLVQDGINGFIIKDLKEMYPKIVDIKNNYKNVMMEYKRGINIAEYDSEHIVKEMFKIYRKIIQK